MSLVSLLLFEFLWCLLVILLLNLKMFFLVVVSKRNLIKSMMNQKLIWKIISKFIFVFEFQIIFTKIDFFDFSQNGKIDILVFPFCYYQNKMVNIYKFCEWEIIFRMETCFVFFRYILKFKTTENIVKQLYQKQKKNIYK